LAPVNKRCFRPVWYVGQKALFLTRALLFPFPTRVDYRSYWNMPKKRSKRRVQVLELQLGSLSFSSRKGEETVREVPIQTKSNPCAGRQFSFTQDTFYIFWKGFILFLLNNYWELAWEGFNVKLDAEQDLNSICNFTEPRFPLIVLEQTTFVLFLTVKITSIELA
jgi:hypothetical protein